MVITCGVRDSLRLYRWDTNPETGMDGWTPCGAIALSEYTPPGGSGFLHPPPLVYAGQDPSGTHEYIYVFGGNEAAFSTNKGQAFNNRTGHPIYGGYEIPVGLGEVNTVEMLHVEYDYGGLVSGALCSIAAGGPDPNMDNANIGVIYNGPPHEWGPSYYLKVERYGGIYEWGRILYPSAFGEGIVVKPRTLTEAGGSVVIEWPSTWGLPRQPTPIPGPTSWANANNAIGSSWGAVSGSILSYHYMDYYIKTTQHYLPMSYFEEMSREMNHYAVGKPFNSFASPPIYTSYTPVLLRSFIARASFREVHIENTGMYSFSGHTYGTANPFEVWNLCNLTSRDASGILWGDSPWMGIDPWTGTGTLGGSSALQPTNPNYADLVALGKETRDAENFVYRYQIIYNFGEGNVIAYREKWKAHPMIGEAEAGEGQIEAYLDLVSTSSYGFAGSWVLVNRLMDYRGALYGYPGRLVPTGGQAPWGLQY
jgi:hypothetical protein